MRTVQSASLPRVMRFTLHGVPCVVRVPQGQGPWPAACLCGGRMEEFLDGLNGPMGAQGPPLLLYAAAGNGEKDYTPWPAPALPDRAPFTGQAGAHLRFLTGEVQPYVRARFPVEPGSREALLGYSLGGLFALWAMYRTDAFSLFGSLSGSLWYDGWLDFAQNNRPAAGAQAYLSLGKGEERGGGRMGTAGACTRATAALLERQLGPGAVSLEWNRGGHFTGTANRWGKALDWAALHAR